jgi:phosphoribosylanthranilate isomerase
MPFRIKICGITNALDGLGALGAGADALGINFYARSLRFLDPARAAEMADTWRKVHPTACLVGVFVNSHADEVAEIANSVGLHMMQLHGDEPVSILESLDARRVIRVIRIAADGWDSAGQEIHEWQAAGVDTFLIDAAAPGQFGGTGRQLDWTRVAALNASMSIRLILAGGLQPTNVAQAIEAVLPAAVDVASGVEGLPGKKDPRLVEQFVRAAREAFELLG